MLGPLARLLAEDGLYMGVRLKLPESACYPGSYPDRRIISHSVEPKERSRYENTGCSCLGLRILWN